MVDCLEGIEQEYRNGWEQTRMLTWVIAQVNSSEELDPSELIKFPWEDCEEVEDEVGIEELRKRAADFKK